METLVVKSGRSRWMVATMVALVWFSSRHAQAQTAPAMFKDADRWCAVGDSVTQDGGYQQWITLYYLTRFPGLDIGVYDCGVAGDSAAGGLKRLGWDVTPIKPSVATVMFGTNEVAQAVKGGKFDAAKLATYRASMRAMVKSLQDVGTRVILMTPSPVDEGVGYNEGADALRECASVVQALGTVMGVPVVDVLGPLERLNAGNRANTPGFSVVGTDSMAPDPAASLFTAYLFLKAQKVPAEVASLSIDLRSGQYAATNSDVEKVVRSSEGLTFVWAEKSLPFPVELDAARALGWAPINNELNREMLQVVGLHDGFWELLIDGERVHAFSAGELASGVNLTEQPITPQYQQAMAVMQLLEARTRLVSDNLRSVALVEHTLVPDVTHPVALEALQPLVEARLADLAKEPAPLFLKRAFELYAERKRVDANSRASAIRLLERARLAAQPQSHVYLLRFEK